MTLSIFIEEQAREVENFSATVRFGEYGSPYPSLAVTNPAKPEEEQELEWYFERWLSFPFTDRVRAERAAGLIREYGESLFAQVFRSDPDIYLEYQRAMQGGGVLLQIVGSPEFHALHWEALKDPKRPHPLAVDQPVVRKNRRAVLDPARVAEASELRVLLLTARPSGRRDVGYRTISRPLIEALETSKLRATIDIVRPGTFEALLKHLEKTKNDHGDGYYHILHLDLHGAVLTFGEYQNIANESASSSDHLFKGYGTRPVEPYDGERAFLMFEDDDSRDGNGGVLVSADELAEQLQMHRVPVVALNACQSGKQAIGTATETSLGSRLLLSGAQLVIAMGYSVTVSAAGKFMTRLYQELLAGREPATAIRSARLELFRDKARRAAYNQMIDLEDWMLPVIYQNAPPQFRFTAAGGATGVAASHHPRPATAYGFFGRDLDVLEIERRLLLRGNLLLVQGMGGAGKSTLLHHLGWWWQKTRFVEQVFYFGYDQKAWHLQEIIGAIGEQLALPLSGRMREDRLEVVRALKHTRHLLMLDNMESITGERLSIPNTLNEAEREEVKGFLRELQDGKTIMLLGSRGDEAWLQPMPLKEHRIFDLPGLDGESGSQLADKILRDIGAPNYPDLPEHRDDFKRLMRLLGGYPLAMEVVLSNLARSTPAEVLERLEAADIDLDNRSATAGKTDSIIKCIDYSHSNLSESAQQLLLTLAPFKGVVDKDWLEQYSERLLAQPALAGLPCEKWDEVLREAEKMGLVKPHEDEWFAENGYLSLQPVFPFFLKSRLNDPAQAERKEAIETAFREHYEGIGDAFWELTDSKEAGQQQAGFALIGVEYENFYTALQIALRQQESILSIYRSLSDFLYKNHQYEKLFDLGCIVQRVIENYPRELLKGQAGYELAGVLVENIGARYIDLHEFSLAEKTYKKALKIFNDLVVLSLEEKESSQAGILYEMGRLSIHQGKWKEAECYYLDAIRIYVKHNNHYARAKALYQLGVLFQEQINWSKAKKYYLDALDVLKEYNYRYEQAKVLHQLGIVAYVERNLVEAEIYYSESYEIKVEYDDYDEQARTLQNLGIIAQEKGQFGDAEKYYKKALAIKIQYNLRYEQASSLGQLGLLAEEQNKWEEAAAYALEVAEIFVEFDDPVSLATSQLILARIWRKTKAHNIVVKLAALLNSSVAECEALLDEAADASESRDGEE